LPQTPCDLVSFGVSNNLSTGALEFRNRRREVFSREPCSVGKKEISLVGWPRFFTISDVFYVSVSVPMRVDGSCSSGQLRLVLSAGDLVRGDHHWSITLKTDKSWGAARFTCRFDGASPFPHRPAHVGLRLHPTSTDTPLLLFPIPPPLTLFFLQLSHRVRGPDLLCSCFSLSVFYGHASDLILLQTRPGRRLVPLPETALKHYRLPPHPVDKSDRIQPSHL